MRLARNSDNPVTSEATTRIAGTPNGWFDRAKGMIFARFGRACVRRMELVEKLELGGRRQLMLVICDGRKYLLGAGSDGIHAIMEVGITPEHSPIPAQDAPCSY